MKVTIPVARVGGRALALGALAAVFVAVSLGLPEPASAAYTARVDAGTLRLTGDGAGEKLFLAPQGGVLLDVDVGGDGTIEHSFDRSLFTAIEVEAGGGDDEVRVIGSLSDEAITLDGGTGADILFGGLGDQTLIGGAGDDDVTGGDGTDHAVLGGGADVFHWSPGDDNDRVDGDGGDDELDFNGANVGEAISVLANGPRARFLRNIANVEIDLGGVELVRYEAFGGADAVVVGDLAGTGVEDVHVDLGAFGGGGDGAADTVTQLGTEGNDTARFSSPGGYPLISGLAAEVLVEGVEQAHDEVNVSTLGGEDTILTGRETHAAAVYNADGGDGADTVRYSGTSVADQIAVIANGSEVAVDSPLASRFDALAVESLVVLGLGGPDTISAVGNLAALTQITMDGGEDGDTISGSNGADLLLGGPGDDHVDGQQGIDEAQLGSGNDRFQWDPGDSSDVVEGQGGLDELAFNGSNIGEALEVTATGTRVRFFRNIANVTLDLAGIERVGAAPSGGADTLVVGDLAGTEVDVVAVDLAAFGGTGDAQPDRVTALGTAGNDRVAFSSPGGAAALSGLAAQVLVTGGALEDELVAATLAGDDTITSGIEVTGATTVNADGGEGADTARYSGTPGADEIPVVANGAEASVAPAGAARFDTFAVESLVVLGLGGQDSISAVGNLAALTTITMDGGEDGDTLRGGNGPDLLLGGPGDDHVDGNQGLDRALLGAGDDRFQWDPGDGNDTVEGQAGSDAVDFNGSNAGETIALAANGRGVELTRNIASIVMDLATIEAVAVRALGGTDTVTVGDLARTGVRTVDVDLGAFAGGGDAAADTVVVSGTNRRDVVQVVRSGLQAIVDGLAAQTRIAGGEPANDTLRVETLGGNDDVTLDPGVNDLLAPVIDLGAND